jgi:hypothetical protein
MDSAAGSPTAQRPGVHSSLCVRPPVGHSTWVERGLWTNERRTLFPSRRHPPCGYPAVGSGTTAELSAWERVDALTDSLIDRCSHLALKDLRRGPRAFRRTVETALTRARPGQFPRKLVFMVTTQSGPRPPPGNENTGWARLVEPRAGATRQTGTISCLPVAFYPGTLQESTGEVE